jgi:hypothetical protein
MHENAVSKAFFCASMVIIIGNGSRINFWQDHWLDGCCITELVPDLYQAVSSRRRKTRLVNSCEFHFPNSLLPCEFT